MDYGTLSYSQTERYKRLATSRTHQAECAIFIQGIDDASNYVKSYSFSRQLSNTLKENNPSRGSIVIADPDGEFVENGHCVVKKGANVIINAGYDGCLIPRFTGVVQNSNIDSANAEITLEIADYAQVLADKNIEGFFSDYPHTKALIDKIIADIKPCVLPVTYENPTGEVATFEFGLKMASFASVCTTGTGTTMTNINEDFERCELGMAIENVTDGSIGLITTITSTAPATTPNDTIVCSGGLHGGTLNVWNNADEYQVYDKLYIDSRSYWSLIQGTAYCVFQVPFIDEYGVLQIKRRSSYTDVDVVFCDKDIISVDYLEDAQIINLKTIAYKKPIIYSDGVTGVAIGQALRKVLAPQQTLGVEYADLTDEPMITSYDAAVGIINQELAFWGYPRYMVTLETTARPDLQYFDRISIMSDKRNIQGKFVIIGIDEEMSLGSFTNRFTLLGTQERF